MPKKTDTTNSSSSLVKDPEKRIYELRESLTRANELYYVDGNSPMSDQEYDSLLEELARLEKLYPEFRDPESPAMRVGSDLAPGFRKVPHKFPMLSIGNTYSLEDVQDFHRQVIERIPPEELEYVVEPKVDGVAMSLVYEDRKLACAITRGDGTVGDEVTRNVKTIASIPQTLPDFIPWARFEVRGEVYMTRANFLAFNEYSLEVLGRELQNPRNTASGSLKLKNPKEVELRKLDFFAYAVLLDKPEGSHWDNLKLLEKAGFPVNPIRCLCKSVEEVMAFCDQWEKKKSELPYNIDGMVIKVNSLKHQAMLGRTSKNPKWVIAYKYKAEAAETVVESVVFQVGRTGAVTPVANLRPVQLGGTLVKRATLHNFDEIERLGLKVRDTVVVEKGGEIIPKINAVVLEKRPIIAKSISIPKECPVCGTELVRLEAEVALRCENLQCPAQVQRAILHFVSRGAMNVEKIGPALVQALLAKGLITNFADIYSLKLEDLADLERMGEKSAQNVMESIETSKQRSLERLIFGLGIRFIGKTSALTLARHFKTLSALLEAKQEDFENIHEIGGRMAESAAAYFLNLHNRELIGQLEKAGVNTVYLESGESQVLSGKTFVITGTLESWSRDEARQFIENAGGKVSESVSKKTSFLLAGEAAGSKLDKARKLDVPVISEAQLKEMLGLAA